MVEMYSCGKWYCKNSGNPDTEYICDECNQKVKKCIDCGYHECYHPDFKNCPISIIPIPHEFKQKEVNLT